jgi:hypothetical protein
VGKGWREPFSKTKRLFGDELSPKQIRDVIIYLKDAEDAMDSRATQFPVRREPRAPLQRGGMFAKDHEETYAYGQRTARRSTPGILVLQNAVIGGRNHAGGHFSISGLKTLNGPM